ncbi:DUF4012 domain-containing protein [Herbidospora sp. NEAU-GS84]|uniref:DUF4012 domain-containing protein n=1 Tax=Herbidospora solisilvae TaxID=2696284 RepID=A0A7C9J1R9_9ACTN|nr:DUF4012 domain-containing protein [Herbidospora solisilvae]NAS21765.1 DUF4012 domain-containing protein [Herbidospora solisilvae]
MRVRWARVGWARVAWKRKGWLRTVVAASALTATTLGVAWPVYLGVSAARHLSDARDALKELAGSTRLIPPGPEIAARIGEARAGAEAAMRYTSGRDWALLARLPFAGARARTVRDYARAALDLATGLELLLRQNPAEIPRAVGHLQAARAVLPQVEALRRLDTLAALAGLRGRFLVAVQSPDRARATGGVVRGFGVVTIAPTGWTVEPVRRVPDAPGPVLDLGPGYAARYGADATRTLSASNRSPHFPYAARVWAALHGQPVDGVIGAEAATLARLSGLAGLPGLMKVIDQGHIRIWSADPEEQRLLERTPLAGVLTPAPGPFAHVVVNDAGGDGIGRNLDRTVEYRLSPECGSTVSATLRNGDRDGRVWVSVFTAVGSRLEKAYLDGKVAELKQETEHGHPVFSTTLDLPAGETRTLELRLVEPPSSAAPVVPEQPMAKPQRTVVTAGERSCS